MSDQIEEINLPQGNPELSERELEILKLLATGLSNKEIAAQLFLSPNTVKVHLRNIFAKLGVQSRTEATLVAIQRGYVSVPNTAVPANDEVADTTDEVVEASVPSEAEEPADTAVVVAPVIVPAIEIEPPLPIGRRVALIAVALIALALALVAVPRGSAQSDSGLCDPFVDTCSTANGAAPVNQTDWQPAAQMSLARGRLAVAAVGADVVAVGGHTPSGVTGLVEIWDSATKQWRTGQNKPVPVANIGAAVLNGKVIVPGGYTAAGAPTAVVEAYDLISDTWTSLAPLPAPRFAQAVAVHNGKVYVFGGWDGRGYANTTFIYDPKLDRWTTGAPLPIGRGFAGAAAMNDAVYVVGGYADDHELDRCDRYLPQEDRWETCAPLSVARGGLSLVPVAGRLYALGGGWTGYLTYNERYDPAANSWSIVPTPFTGQWRGLGATNIGNDIYALGGWNGQYLSTVEKYNPFPFSIFVPATAKQ
jgi:DNA-binding CsgD family transcriptional regulator